MKKQIIDFLNKVNTELSYDIDCYEQIDMVNKFANRALEHTNKIKEIEMNIKFVQKLINMILETEFINVNNKHFGMNAFYDEKNMFYNNEASVKDILVELFTYYQGYFLNFDNSKLEDKLKNAGALALLCFKTIKGEVEDKLHYMQNKRHVLFERVINEQQYFVSKEKYDYMSKRTEEERKSFSIIFSMRYRLCFKKLSKSSENIKESKYSLAKSRIEELELERDVKLETLREMMREINEEYNNRIKNLLII